MVAPPGHPWRTERAAGWGALARPHGGRRVKGTHCLFNDAMDRALAAG